MTKELIDSPVDIHSLYKSYVDQLIEKNADSYQYTVEHSSREFSWCHMIPRQHPVVRQGWKIHITFSFEELKEMFIKVIPFLTKNQLSFKIPATLHSFDYLNSAKAGNTQIGKIITVYPPDNSSFLKIVKQIDQLWPHSNAMSPPSDLCIRKSGAVSVRYGIFRSHEYVYDSNGQPHPALRTPEGELIPDIRSEKGTQPAFLPPLPFPTFKNTDTNIFEKIIINRTLIFIPMMLIQSRVFMKVYYGINASDGSVVIIKYVPKNSYKEINGPSVADRLKNEYDILVQLQHTKLAPFPLGFYQNKKGSFLIMELLEGSSLAVLDQSTQIELLPSLIRAVDILHNHGVIHCDLKLTNVMSTSNGIKILDFENSLYKPQNSKRINGTRNYMAPEGNRQSLTHKYDIYALGSCMEHIFLKRDPGTLSSDLSQRESILPFYCGKKICQLIKACHSADPEFRPDLAYVSKTIGHLHSSGNFFPAKNTCRPIPEKTLRQLIHSSGTTLLQYSIEQDNKIAWRNTHYAKNFQIEGLNLGAGGILLGLISTSQTLKIKQFDSYIEKTANWLLTRQKETLHTGLFVGSAGVALSLLATGSYLKKPIYTDKAIELIKYAALTNQMTDVFAGIAGVLFAACVAFRITNDDSLRDISTQLAKKLISAAEEENGVIVWKPSFISSDRVEYFSGAAHGSSGIAMSLSYYGKLMGDKAAIQFSRKCFTSLMRNSFDKSKSSMFHQIGAVSTMSGNSVWCHGSAGLLWCLLVANDLTKITKSYIKKLVSLLEKDNGYRDITYCHGLSGQLEIWNMLRRVPEYKKKASANIIRLQHIIYKSSIQKSGQTFWLSDDPEIITPDLWIGFSGPITALSSSIEKNQTAFLELNWIK